MATDPAMMGQLLAGSPQQSMLAQMAAQYGGTQAVPAIQRSQYLADALAAMQKSGGENIRSGSALATNLMAEALLQYGRNRANAQLLKQIGQGQSKEAADAATGVFAPTPGPAAPAPTPDASAMGGTPPPPAPPDPFGPAVQPTPDAAPGPTPASAPTSTMSATDRDLLARTILGEAGDSPDDMRAAGSVILNRAHMAGQGIGDVIHAPHQFEAVDNPKTWAHLAALPPTDRRLQQAYQIADDLQAKGPAGPWDHFYAPRAQAALGRQMPKWDNGSGQQIGGQKFFALGYGGHPAMQGGAPTPQPTQIATGPGPSMPAAPPPPQPMGAQPMGQTPGPQGGQMIPAAYQPGQPPQAGAGAPPVGSPQPGAPSPAGGMSGPPTGPYATPEEVTLINQGKAYPPGSIPWQRAIELERTIQARHATPLEAPKDMMWDNQRGAYVPKPGTQYNTVASGPAGVTQADPFGQYHATANPNVAAPPPGMQFGADGGLHQTPVEQMQTFKIPGANGVFVRGPDGRPVKVADDSFTPKDLGDRLTKLQGSDQFKLADTATNMYNAAIQAAQRPGGISDVELRDFAARQFSGGVARQFNVEALNHAQGAWANLKQFVPELVSGQKMSPQARAAVLQAMHDDAVQAQTSFGALSQSDEAFANSQGMSLRPYLSPLTRPLPPVPGAESIPNGMNPAARAAAPQPTHGEHDPGPAGAPRGGFWAKNPQTGQQHYYTPAPNGQRGYMEW